MVCNGLYKACAVRGGGGECGESGGGNDRSGQARICLRIEERRKQFEGVGVEEGS